MMTREEYLKLKQQKEEIEKQLKGYKDQIEGKFFIIDNEKPASATSCRLIFKQATSSPTSYRNTRLYAHGLKGVSLKDYIQMLIDDLESLKKEVD